jgi:hypothetical protein
MSASVAGRQREIDAFLRELLPYPLEAFIVRQGDRAQIACALQFVRRIFHIGLHQVLDRVTYRNYDPGGKPEGIHLMIGRRPRAAFGNSGGDRQMLEYTGAGDGARLMMLVLHDDAQREYAYGPAQGLPASRVGTFTQALYDEAKKKSWSVVSMKNDWKRIFAFEQTA